LTVGLARLADELREGIVERSQLIELSPQEAGRIAGMITEVVAVRDLIEGMFADAARLAEAMPTITKE
jgi:hypothetical protein